MLIKKDPFTVKCLFISQPATVHGLLANAESTQTASWPHSAEIQESTVSSEGDHINSLWFAFKRGSSRSLLVKVLFEWIIHWIVKICEVFTSAVMIHQNEKQRLVYSTSSLARWKCEVNIPVLKWQNAFFWECGLDFTFQLWVSP